MKTKLIISALFISTLTPTLTQAFGNRHTWVSGWAQGVSEFIILGKGQSQLYLACEDTGSRPASIIFTDVSGHQVRMNAEQHFEMKFDGEDVANIRESASHAGSSHVESAWNLLRVAKQVTVSGEGAKPVTFTLNGAAAVIPQFGDDGCMSQFVLPHSPEWP